MANPSGQCIEEGNKINGLLKERASAENAASRKPQRNLINSGQLTRMKFVVFVDDLRHFSIMNKTNDNATLSIIIKGRQAVRFVSQIIA